MTQFSYSWRLSKQIIRYSKLILSSLRVLFSFTVWQICKRLCMCVCVGKLTPLTKDQLHDETIEDKEFFLNNSPLNY